MLKSILPLSIATALSRLSGFARDYILAQVYLTGPLLDLFFVLFRFPQYTRRFFAEGSLSQALIPSLGQAFEGKDKEQAQSLYAQTFWFIVIVLGFFVLSVYACPSFWTYLLAPGFDMEQKKLLIEYLPLAASYSISLSLISLYALVLQLQDSYWLNGVSPLILNLALIISALFFKQSGLFALISLMVLSGIVQVVLQALSAKQYLLTLLPSWPRWTPDFYKVLKNFVELSPLAVIILFNTLFDQRMLTYSDPGEISLYYLSERIIDLPVGILGYSIYSVFAGYYMRQFADEQRRKELEQKVVFFVLILVLPAAGAITILAPQIMRLFIKLPSQEIYAALLLRIFSLNIIPIVLNKIFVIVLNAHGYRSEIVKAHFYGMLMNAALDLILFSGYQGAGIAVSTTITLFLQLIIFERFYPFLWQRFGELCPKNTILTLLYMIASLGLLWFGVDIILSYDLGHWENIIVIMVWGSFVGIMYLRAIWPQIKNLS